jgi:hypothetical protein
MIPFMAVVTGERPVILGEGGIYFVEKGKVLVERSVKPPVDLDCINDINKNEES